MSQHVETQNLPNSTSGDYPVLFDVKRPDTYERAQVALRLLVLVLLGVLSAPLGWIFGLLYLVLPAIAAIGITSAGPAGYLSEFSIGTTRGIRWVLSLYAYLLLVTDRFPVWGSHESVVRFEVKPSGTPTVGSALLRLVTTLPYALVLFALGAVGVLVWLVALATVLGDRRVPDTLYDFLCGLLRWQARLLAYHASLVEEYPPWSFDYERLSADEHEAAR